MLFDKSAIEIYDKIYGIRYVSNIDIMNRFLHEVVRKANATRFVSFKSDCKYL